MHLTLEETSDLPETTVSLPAPFLLEGNEDNVRVTYAKDTVGPEELSDAMLMAYWEEGESRSWNELKAEYGKASTRMYDLAKAAMQDPDEVLREQLQRVANKFSTELPQPKNSITVVSQDGHTTVTYDPTPSPVQPEGEFNRLEPGKEHPPKGTAEPPPTFHANGRRTTAPQQRDNQRHQAGPKRNNAGNIQNDKRTNNAQTHKATKRQGQKRLHGSCGNPSPAPRIRRIQ